MPEFEQLRVGICYKLEGLENVVFGILESLKEAPLRGRSQAINDNHYGYKLVSNDTVCIISKRFDLESPMWNALATRLSWRCRPKILHCENAC